MNNVIEFRRMIKNLELEREHIDQAISALTVLVGKASTNGKKIKAAWTPERRARQARLMRARMRKLVKAKRSKQAA